MSATSASSPGPRVVMSATVTQPRHNRSETTSDRLHSRSWRRCSTRRAEGKISSKKLLVLTNQEYHERQTFQTPAISLPADRGPTRSREEGEMSAQNSPVQVFSLA